MYPFALALGHDGTAEMWIGGVGPGVRLLRGEGAPRGGERVYVAADTTLVLAGAFVGETFAGVLRGGDGRGRAVSAKAYLGPRVPLAAPAPPPSGVLAPVEWVGRLAGRSPAPSSASDAVPSAATFPPDFLTACGSDKWLRAYVSPRGHRLVLAKLPAGRLAGSLYLGEVGTTLLARGTLAGDGFRVRLTRPDGAAAGEVSVTGDVPGGGRLSAKLSLGDATEAMTLDIAEALAMDVRQHRGRLDVALPAGVDEDALERFADQQYGRLVTADARGSVWFEALRLDAAVLSGYVHVRTDGPGGTDETTALTLDRRTGRLLSARRLAAGPKRQRQSDATARLRYAAAAHPLRDDPDFRRWLATAQLAEVAVLTEGLAYATEYHPVYGAVHWTTPWTALAEPLRNRTAAFR